MQISRQGARTAGIAFGIHVLYANNQSQSRFYAENDLKGGKRASNSSRPRIDVVETAQDWTGGYGSGA